MKPEQEKVISQNKTEAKTDKKLSKLAAKLGLSVLLASGTGVAIDHFLQPNRVEAQHLSDCQAGIIIDEINELGDVRDEYPLRVVTPTAFDDGRVTREEILATAELEDGLVNGRDRFSWQMDSNATRDGVSAWTAWVYNPNSLDGRTLNTTDEFILKIPETLCGSYREVNIEEVPLSRLTPPTGSPVSPPSTPPANSSNGPTVTPSGTPTVPEVTINTNDPVRAAVEVQEVNDWWKFIPPALIVGAAVLGAGFLAGRSSPVINNEVPEPYPVDANPEPPVQSVVDRREEPIRERVIERPVVTETRYNEPTVVEQPPEVVRESQVVRPRERVIIR